jgi:hypothetical protein
MVKRLFLLGMAALAMAMVMPLIRKKIFIKLKKSPRPFESLRVRVIAKTMSGAWQHL